MLMRVLVADMNDRIRTHDTYMLMCTEGCTFECAEKHQSSTRLHLFFTSLMIAEYFLSFPSFHVSLCKVFTCVFTRVCMCVYTHLWVCAFGGLRLLPEVFLHHSLLCILREDRLSQSNPDSLIFPVWLASLLWGSCLCFLGLEFR